MPHSPIITHDVARYYREKPEQNLASDTPTHSSHWGRTPHAGRRCRAMSLATMSGLHFPVRHNPQLYRILMRHILYLLEGKLPERGS